MTINALIVVPKYEAVTYLEIFYAVTVYHRDLL